MAEMFQLIGTYLRPNRVPHEGFITVTPLPTSVQDVVQGAVITLQAARLDLDSTGSVSAELLDPNDPGLRPGGATGDPWAYCIREVLLGSAIIGWLLLPESITDGVADLGKVPRTNLDVIRPSDWFPHHWAGAPSAAGRISPQ